MVTITEAKESVQARKQELVEKRTQAEQARQTLQAQARKLPEPTQRRLRAGLFAGLSGRQRARQIGTIREKIKAGQRGITSYEQELAQYEQEQLVPAEQQVATIEKQQGAYNVLRREIIKTIEEYEGQFTSAQSINDVREAFSNAGLDPDEGEELYKTAVSAEGTHSLWSEDREFLGTYDLGTGKVQAAADYDFSGFNLGQFTFTRKGAGGQSLFRDLPRQSMLEVQDLPKSFPTVTGFGIVSAQSELPYTPATAEDLRIRTTGSPIKISSVLGEVSKRVPYVLGGYMKDVPKFLARAEEKLDIGISRASAVARARTEFEKKGIVPTAEAFEQEVARQKANIELGYSFSAPFVPARQVPTKIALRGVKPPSFVEYQRPFVLRGKPSTISQYAITREVSAPTLVARRGEGLIGGIIRPARVEVTRTPLPVLGEKSPFFTFTTKGGQVGRLDVLVGKSVPRTLSELRSLPTRERFLWQRVAESRAGGRPVALENVPKILKGRQLTSGEIRQLRLARVERKPRGVLEFGVLEPKYAGRRVKRFETVAQFGKAKVEPQFDVFKGSIFFKEVTKPLARATGKTPKLKGTIFRFREPLVVGEEAGIQIFRGTGTKTPLGKTFGEQLLKTEVKVLPKPLPKATKVVPTKAKEVSPVTRPAMVGATTGLNILDTTVDYGKTAGTTGILGGVSGRVSDGEFFGDISDYRISGRSTSLLQTETPTRTTAQTTSLLSKQAPRESLQFRTPQVEVSRVALKTQQRFLQRPAQTIKQVPRITQVPRQTTKLRQTLRSLLKTGGRIVPRTTTTPRLLRPPTPPPLVPPPKPRVVFSSNKGKIVLDAGLYQVYVKRFGVDTLIASVSSLAEAKRILATELVTTLRASGLIRKGGKPVKVRLREDVFRPAKREPFRVVQRRGKRLAARSEVREILGFKKRKGKNLWGL